MAVETKLRPTILSTNTVLTLDELCRFRHFVRNAHTHELDHILIQKAHQDLLSIQPRIQRPMA